MPDFYSLQVLLKSEIKERQVTIMNNEKREKFYPITNDFVFNKVFSNKEIVKQFLKEVLGVSISDEELDNLRINHQQVFDPSKDQKGVRFDVCLLDLRHLIDIEMQNEYIKELVLRSRYYVSSSDVDFLKAGHSYEELPQTVILFICMFDPFNLGKARYDVEERVYVHSHDRNGQITVEDVTEDAGYDAKIHKIFLNVTATDFSGISEKLKKILLYFKDNTSTDTYTKELDTLVQKVNVEDWREIMTLEERDKRNQEKGELKTKIEIARNFIGIISNEMIAEKVGLPLSEVKKLAEEVSKEKKE